MKHFNTSFLALLLCLLVFDLSAQAPKLLNYQGVARHSDGSMIANQEIDLRISLISAVDIDRLVYTETHSITTNTFGLFSLKIGSGEVIYGSMDGIDWASAEHFITTEMDVEQVGQFTLMGTSQLVSVPYAFYAEKSGIAETTVDGTGRAIDFPGSNGQTIRHNGTEWEASSGLYHSTSGNIGIGTTVPTSELDVDGDINIAQDRVLRIAGNQVISTKGQRNMFIGDGTGNFVTTGQDNTAIGFKAAEQLSEGTFNTIIGFKAAQNMSTALSNTIIGREAGKNSTGNQNVLIGREAGKNAEGSENTVIGDKAGLGITTGGSNTLIGKNANVGSGSLTNATAIGAGANANASNSVILGNNANVGVGTSSPQYKLEVVGDAKVSGSFYDSSGDQGTTGQILSSTGAGTDWVTGSGGGATGPTGPTGPQGIQGIAGINGLDGTTGPQGLAGINGIDGAAGTTGPTGIQGIAGSNGEQGDQGIVGPTGPAGSQGATGSPGPQGTAGSDGSNGSDGVTGPTGLTGAAGPTGPGASMDSVWSIYGQSLLPTDAFLGTLDGRDIPFRTNDTEVMRITNGGGLLINSTVAGSVNSSGAGRKLIWDATKMAFRVGSVSGSQWDSSNIGAGSIAMGIDPTASGENSVAIGLANEASGVRSTIIGSSSSATGNYALAVGASDTASGLNSTALGQLNAATAYLSSAVGSSNEASGVESSAFGHSNIASDSSATAIGHRASATKKDAKAFGVNAAATGENSTAIGANVLASGKRSLAIGDHVKATGEGSIIIGNGNVTAWAPSAIETANDSANTFKLTMANYPNALPEIVALHDNSALFNYRAKVGIGKVPTTNLDVSGALKADIIVLPELGIGNASAVIVNDGDGVMKWQNAATAPFWNTIGANHFYGSTSPHYIGTTLGETGDLGFKVNGKEVGRFTNGGAFVLSGDNSGMVPTGLTGAHLMWSPQKRAFRTMDGDSIHWAPDNMGVLSFAHGSEAVASGDNAISLGYHNSASGDRTLAFGTSNSATGDNGVALGNYNSVGSGIAFGNSLIAGNGIAIGSGFTSNATGAVQIGVTNPTVTVGNKKVGINTPTPSIPLDVHSPDNWNVAQFVGDAGHTFVTIKTGSSAPSSMDLQFGDTVRDDLWEFSTTTDGDGEPNDFILRNANMSSWNPMKIGPLGGATFWSQATLPALGI